MFLLPRPGAGKIRLGISVGKRAGRAVMRNRLRRRVREIFRRNRPGSGTGLALVVNLRPSAAAASFSELANDYLLTFERGLARIRAR